MIVGNVQQDNFNAIPLAEVPSENSVSPSSSASHARTSSKISILLGPVWAPIKFFTGRTFTQFVSVVASNIFEMSFGRYAESVRGVPDVAWKACKKTGYFGLTTVAIATVVFPAFHFISQTLGEDSWIGGVAGCLAPQTWKGAAWSALGVSAYLHWDSYRARGVIAWTGIGLYALDSWTGLVPAPWELPYEACWNLTTGATKMVWNMPVNTKITSIAVITSVAVLAKLTNVFVKAKYIVWDIGIQTVTVPTYRWFAAVLGTDDGLGRD